MPFATRLRHRGGGPETGHRLHRDDPLVAQALERLEAAADAVELTNFEARELLSDFGEPDPTQPAARMAGGDTDADADPRRVTQDG